MRSVPLACFLVFGVQSVVLAGGNAAPSSHLVYNDANFAGDGLINEVRVPAEGEAMFTYYEGLGWSGKAGGYAGIQAHPKGHNYIFSIWDHKEHTAPIRAVHRGPGTLTENFGGEGTGLKSWNFELGWETDVWYTLVARCWPVGDHTFYGYWVRSDRTGIWTHLVTMDVAVPNALLLGGNDSFIEDWLETGKNRRTGHYRNGWKRKPNGKWHPFASARYSVNYWDLTEGKRSFNYRTNWDGGVAEDKTGKFYFMTAGGAKTKPTTTNPSQHSIPRTAKTPDYERIGIRSAEVKPTGPGTVLVRWRTDPNTVPQLRYTVIAHRVGDADGTPIVTREEIVPHAREVRIELPTGVDATGLRWQVRCRDIFDRDSEPATAKLISR